MKERIIIFIGIISILISSCVTFTQYTHISSRIRIKGLVKYAKIVRIDLDSSWCFMVDRKEFIEYSNTIRDLLSFYNINSKDNDTVRIIKASFDDEMRKSTGKYIKYRIAKRVGLIIYNYKRKKYKRFLRYEFFDEQPAHLIGAAGYRYIIKGTKIGISDKVIRRY